MNAFVNGIGHKISAPAAQIVTTDNGAKSYASTMNACLDFFRRAGSARGQNLNADFDRAYQEDADLAIRGLLWLRDIRGGAGEREAFRKIMIHMSKHEKYASLLSTLIELTPEYGRFDDLTIYDSGFAREKALEVFANAIKNQNGLAAKWAPREKSKKVSDRRFAVDLANKLGLNPKQYRKTIVELTKVVETQMCAKKWDGINYSHVPSVATRRYTKAFYKHDATRYAQFVADAANGKVKVNASAIFPHDIIQESAIYDIGSTTEKLADAQWQAMPNFTNGRRILPVIDTSSSMTTLVPGTRMSHMHVAITLGMYVAEKNTGAFNNVFLTFNDNPTLERIHSNRSIFRRYQDVKGSNWGGSTNFQKSFDLILKHAVKNSVPQDQMPEIIIVVSDMQFNQAGNLTNYQAIRQKYEDAGYKIPQIVFWQLNGSKQDAQARHDTVGVSMISGFSPAVLKGVLSGDLNVEETSPMQTMLDTLMVDRYNWNK